MLRAGYWVLEGVTGEPRIPSPRLPSPCDADVPPAPLGGRSTRAAGVRGRSGRVAAGRSDVIMSAAVAANVVDVESTGGTFGSWGGRSATATPGVGGSLRGEDDPELATVS